jgi:hypothetical protein
MAKFVRVTAAPESVGKGEYVIAAPNFLEEIEACRARRPKNGLMSANYLRDIFAIAGQRYLGDSFNAMTDVNVSYFRNREFKNEEDVNVVVIAACQKFCPQLLDAYVAYHIKRRPAGTKLIYFTGGLMYTSQFFANGIDEIKEKDIEVELGRKEKRIVGKPAITDEQARSNTEGVV